MSDAPLALVLSGGGARGAYEVGVLAYVAERLPGLLERVKIITGTSVGAVNGAFLAGNGLTPAAVEQLAETWRGLVLDELLSLSAGNAFSIVGRAGLRLLSKRTRSPTVGLLEVGGLQRLVASKTNWRGIHRHLREGRFSAFAVAATDIASGDTHLFYQGGPGLAPVWSRNDPTLVPTCVPIGPHHVLASAAIPILFPPVRIGRRWYMDGGLRYNTPLSPALSLGAHGMIIVSVRTQKPDPVPESPEFPGLGHVIGKILDAVFLDRVAYDLDRISRINDLMSAIATLPPEMKERLETALNARGRRPYRVVPYVDIRPGFDLGGLAATHLRGEGKGSLRSVGRHLWALFEDDAMSTADGASFLLFDGGYARRLIDAGRQDAEAVHGRLAAL